MTEQEIFTVAQALGGGSFPDGEASVLLSLCREAKSLWESRLRAGFSPETCREAFLTACAWTALAGLQGGGVTAFSAGDLSVQMGQTGASMQRQAERLMAPYTEDGGFAFLEVEG